MYICCSQQGMHSNDPLSVKNLINKLWLVYNKQVVYNNTSRYTDARISTVRHSCEAQQLRFAHQRRAVYYTFRKGVLVHEIY